MSSEDMQKITIEVPTRLLKAAKAYTKDSTAATVRAGLDRLAQMEMQRRLLGLEGILPKDSLSIAEMRSWEEG